VCPLQYKAERVLGTAAGVSPADVASKLYTQCEDDDRSGCEVELKVVVAVAGFRDAVELEAKLNSSKGVRGIMEKVRELNNSWQHPRGWT
jgi:hypothetical protein